MCKRRYLQNALRVHSSLERSAGSPSQASDRQSRCLTSSHPSSSGTEVHTRIWSSTRNFRYSSRAVFYDDRTRRGGVGTEAVAESASSFDVGSSPIDEIVKYLTTLGHFTPLLNKHTTSVLGWDKAWIDGVTERIAKKQLITNADTVKAACQYLLGVGLQQGQLCNMASLCYSILGYKVEDHLKPVVDFLTSKGITNIPKLLAMQPKLLDYTVAKDGSCLMKGKLRVAIKVEKKEKEEQEVLVVTYREGAAFNTAPLTPYSP